MSNPVDEIIGKVSLLDGICNRCEDIEAVGEEAAEIAIDITLDSVVEWLLHRGHLLASLDLKELIDGTI